MKVVINKSKNRFCLSHLALKMICEDKKIDAFFYKQEFKSGNKFAYKMKKEDFFNSDDNFFITIYKKDYGNTIKLTSDKHKFSIKSELYDMYEFKNREDESLVNIVETLGDKASFDCDLRIIEIPDKAFNIYAYIDERNNEHIVYDI